MKNRITYKSSGVNVSLANRFINKAKPLIKKTFNKNVLGDIGAFAGCYRLSNNYIDPVLVSCTDGVGTKLKIAFMLNKHDTVGIDLVAMCVNDLIAQGAKPLFFLDYLATGKLNNRILLQIIKGIVQGCKESGCVLIGGETAELPGFYKKGEYDLAGFVVGIVERKRIINGKRIRIGDKIIGIPSNGLHSNGYSLARKILFEKSKLKVTDFIEVLKTTIGEELIKPTKIYSKLVLKIIEKWDIKGIAHITGGGLIDNIPRILPQNCQALIKKEWQVPPIFSLIQKKGKIEKKEMYRTFNMGVGMALVVSPRIVDKVRNNIAYLGEESYILGEIIKAKKCYRDTKIEIQGVN